MITIMLPFFAFVVVVLFMLLLYGAWTQFLDPRKKAKKERLQSIYNVIHSGGQNSSRIVRSNARDSALDTWLRSRSRTFVRLEHLVQRAHSPLSVVSLTCLMLALFAAVVTLGFLRQFNPLLVLMLAVVITSTPVLWLSRQASKRRKVFEDKLPETLDYISRALRAGHSLTSALGMVGKEFADTTGQEFKTVFDEISFGIPFKEAIGQLADRVKSNDLNFFVISLMIQHDTGGNLTELLDSLAGTMRERVKLRGKIRTLSSEGRISAVVLGAIPFVFAGIIALIRPAYISILWTTPQGRTLALIGGMLMAFGFYVLNRMIQIKV